MKNDADDSNIISRLVARAAKKQKPGGKNHAEFLAVKSEALTALAAGFPVTHIWELLHDEGKITLSYQTFKKYLRRYSKTGTKENPPSPAGASPTPRNSPKRFKFSIADKDELLKEADDE